VHHSQEELSILTTYRAHPLVHVSFLFSAVPVLAVADNTATPAVVLTAYACLGALPHANVRWTYGKRGRIFISPAYHRIHRSATGRLDINLGTVFAIWDVLSAGRCSLPRTRTRTRTRSSRPACPDGPSRSSRPARDYAWAASCSPS
jgi:sterol desaturase/sphingolipid hydroxylase (fatty acid hydroxylase superfamily)